MKKKGPKYKKFLIKIAHKKGKYKSKRKKHNKNKNLLNKAWYKSYIDSSLDLQEVKKYNRTFQKAYPSDSIEVPKIFSLVKNTKETIKYFKKNEDLLRQGKSINFDFSGVQELGLDGITLLIACIKNKTFREISPAGRRIYGKPPINPKLSKIFKDSGFYQHVKSNFYDPTENTDCGKLVFISDVRVRGKITQKILTNLSKITNGGISKSLNDMLYEVIGEATGNTCEHAGKFNKNEYYWWVTYYYHEDTNSVDICLLDLGEGIFRTLQQSGVYKDKGIIFSQNPSHLKKMLHGEVAYSSSEKQAERGHGLKTFYQFSQREDVTSAIIISNNVYADVIKDEYTRLQTQLHGTFCFFTIQL